MDFTAHVYGTRRITDRLLGTMSIQIRPTLSVYAYRRKEKHAVKPRRRVLSEYKTQKVRLSFDQGIFVLLLTRYHARKER